MAFSESGGDGKHRWCLVVNSRMKVFVFKG